MTHRPNASSIIQPTLTQPLPIYRPANRSGQPPGRPLEPCDGCPPPPDGADPLDHHLGSGPPPADHRPFQNGLEWLDRNDVWSIIKGLLWLGTRTGLVRFDPATAHYKRYTQQDGLPTNYVVGIVEAEAGELWLSTQKGIARFDSVKETFRNFDVHDGLQGNEFRTQAAWKSSDGTLYFGGSNGITAFNPRQIKRRSIPAASPIDGFADYELAGDDR